MLGAWSVVVGELETGVEGPDRSGELDMVECVMVSSTWPWRSGVVDPPFAACASSAFERAEAEGWWAWAWPVTAFMRDELEPVREKAVRGRRGFGMWRWKNPPPPVLLPEVDELVVDLAIGGGW